MTNANVPTFIIRPTKGWRFLDLRELWAYRELIYFLTWRDIKVRYKQTVVGVAWAVLQPLALMIVFTLFFGRLANIPSEGIPYPLFAYAALLPWQLFSRTITESTTSLVTNQRLITKIYFPRIIVPVSSVVAGMVDFVISLSLLILLMFGYGIVPSWHIIWFPVFMGLMMITAIGIGLWLSSLNLEYRDVSYIIPFVNQFWLFITPVVYPSSLVPQKWQFLYNLNPMVGTIEGIRWALFGTGTGPNIMLFVSTTISIIIFLTGIVWFRWRERVFVDVVGS